MCEIRRPPVFSVIRGKKKKVLKIVAASSAICMSINGFSDANSWYFSTEWPAPQFPSSYTPSLSRTGKKHRKISILRSARQSPKRQMCFKKSVRVLFGLAECHDASAQAHLRRNRRRIKLRRSLRMSAPATPCPIW